MIKLTDIIVCIITTIFRFHLYRIYLMSVVNQLNFICTIIGFIGIFLSIWTLIHLILLLFQADQFWTYELFIFSLRLQLIMNIFTYMYFIDYDNLDLIIHFLNVALILLCNFSDKISLHKIY